MNILLIWPPNPDYCLLTEDFSCCEPLGLEYIASTLLPENEVEIVDMRFHNDIMGILARKKYDLIGLSIPYTTSINACNKLLKQIHDYDPSVIKVIGGTPPSVSLKGLTTEYVDYVIIGEGLFSILELTRAIKYKEDVSKIDGIAIINKNEIKYTNPRENECLNKYPFPSRHLLKENADKYFHAHYKPVSLVRFSYGCPYHCSFCILWKMSKRKYITRENDNIVEEIAGIQNDNLYVVDDEAFIDAKKMKNLADCIIGNKIKKRYHMYVRSDTVVKNPDLIEKWAEAGLDSVLIGLESVYDDELALYNKKLSLHIARECVTILHKNKVEIRANFIIRPEYTHEDFERVKKVVSELDIDRPTFAVLTPFIGTDVYNEVKDKFITNRTEFFDCYHTFLQTKLPLKEFYKEFANLFRTASNRDASGNGKKIFYSGHGNSFNMFLDKIEQSYLFY